MFTDWGKSMFIKICRYLLITGLVLMIGCFGANIYSNTQIKNYFGLVNSERIDTASIRSALLKAFPQGSTYDQVSNFLKQKIVDKREKGIIIPDKDNGILWRVTVNNRVSIIALEYAVFFHFDADKKLQDIKVEEWLTGP
jgi:hypothetical protein